MWTSNFAGDLKLNHTFWEVSSQILRVTQKWADIITDRVWNDQGQVWRCRHLASIHGIYSRISNGFSSDSQKGHQDWWRWEKHGGLKGSAYMAAPLANSLSEIQHLNQSKAVQQSVQFPAEGGTSQCCSCSYISRGENVKVPRVLPSWTYNSQSPECSSARLRGTSADPSCRQLLL